MSRAYARLVRRKVPPRMPAFDRPCTLCGKPMQKTTAPTPVCMGCKARSYCVNCCGPVTRSSPFCSTWCQQEWKRSQQVTVEVRPK